MIVYFSKNKNPHYNQKGGLFNVNVVYFLQRGGDDVLRR